MPSDAELIKAAEERDKKAKACFKKYDKDGSDSIDETEVLCLMDDLGLLAKLQTDEASFLANYFAKAGVL